MDEGREDESLRLLVSSLLLEDSLGLTLDGSSLLNELEAREETEAVVDSVSLVDVSEEELTSMDALETSEEEGVAT